SANRVRVAPQLNVARMHSGAEGNEHDGGVRFLKIRADLGNSIQLSDFCCLSAFNAHRSSSCRPHISSSILRSISPTRRAASTNAFLKPGSVMDSKAE